MSNQLAKGLGGLSTITGAIPGVGTAISAVSGLAAGLLGGDSDLVANPYRGPGLGGGLYAEPPTSSPYGSFLWGVPPHPDDIEAELAKYELQVPTGTNSIALDDQERTTLNAFLKAWGLGDRNRGALCMMRHLAKGRETMNVKVNGVWRKARIGPRGHKTIFTSVGTKMPELIAMKARIEQQIENAPAEPVFWNWNMEPFDSWVWDIWHTHGVVIPWFPSGVNAVRVQGEVYTKFEDFRAHARKSSFWRNFFETKVVPANDEGHDAEEGRWRAWLEEQAIEAERQRVIAEAAQAAAAQFNAAVAAATNPNPSSSLVAAATPPPLAPPVSESAPLPDLAARDPEPVSAPVAAAGLGALLLLLL